MSGGGFGVSPDEVRAHAKKITQVSDRLGTAGSAAGEATLNTEAFGLIGQFLVPQVLMVSGTAKAAISTAEQSTEKLFQAVKSTADDYQETDETNSTIFPEGRMNA